MKQARVNIILPSYNHEAYVTQAVDSVLAQTFMDWRLFISDDASSDGTMELLKKYNDPRIQMLHRFDVNRGAGINTRYLLDRCGGEYIALINSDDVWLPMHLELCLRHLDEHPECGAVFSWADMIDEDGRIISANSNVFRQKNKTRAGWLRQFFTQGNCICHPSMLIRREVYERVGCYSMPMRQLPDFWMWIETVKAYDIHVLPQVLVQHRRCARAMQNTSSATQDNMIRDANEALFILMHFFDGVSDELFKEAFGRYFRRKDASTPVQLICERYFLLLDSYYYMDRINTLAAMYYFIEQCNRLDVLDTLEKEYNYSINDFYKVGIANDLIGARERQLAAQETMSGARQRFNQLFGQTALYKSLRKAYRRFFR